MKIDGGDHYEKSAMEVGIGGNGVGRPRGGTGCRAGFPDAAGYHRCAGRGGRRRRLRRPAARREDVAGDEPAGHRREPPRSRSEETTSELQALMRISYAVFCLTK